MHTVSSVILPWRTALTENYPQSANGRRSCYDPQNKRYHADHESSRAYALLPFSSSPLAFGYYPLSLEQHGIFVRFARTIRAKNKKRALKTRFLFCSYYNDSFLDPLWHFLSPCSPIPTHTLDYYILFLHVKPPFS